MMMLIKYSYLILDVPHPLESIAETFYFDDSSGLKIGDITDDLNKTTELWVGWLGSIQWNALSGEKLILFTHMPTQTSDVIDEENKTLRQKLLHIFLSLPLSGFLRPKTNKAFLLTGKGSLNAENISVEDIREFASLDCWTSTLMYAAGSARYFKWARGSVRIPQFLEDWKTNFHSRRKFSTDPHHYRQILESLRSFDEAVKNHQLEFKIPNFIRAIECLVHGWGAEGFVKGLMHLLSSPLQNLPNDLVNQKDLPELLKNLYEIRNDCVHGKPFGWSLKSKGVQVNDSIAAKYAILTEWLARQVLVGAFSNESIIQAAHDRETLEKAWDQNKILPHR